MPNSVGDFYLGEPALFLISVQNISNPPTPLNNIRTIIQTESRNLPRTDAHDSKHSKNSDYTSDNYNRYYLLGIQGSLHSSLYNRTTI